MRSSSLKILISRLSIVFVALVFLLSMSSSSVYAAMTWGDINDIIGNKTFYRASDDCSTTSNAPTSAGGTLKNGDKVYIIGDSITVRASGAYTNALQTKGISATISARVGRSWTGSGQEESDQVGTQGPANTAVNTDSAKISEANGIIVALGTNGGVQQNPIDEIITKMRTLNPKAPIWWVNTANVGVSLVPTFNNALKSASSGKFQVIDWANVVDPGGDGTHDKNHILADGTHPNASGVTALSDLVVNTVTTSSSSDSSATPSGGSGQSSISEATYTDQSRAGRSVGITYYMPESSPAPLVLFAPGRGQNSKENGFYQRYLKSIASQGFVVAGINFPDNNSYEAAGVDGGDIKFLIDSILADNNVKNKINAASGVGMIGHSDGGFVALMGGYALGKKDDRIKAVIAEDSAIYGGTNNVAGPPLFLIHGTADTIENISSSVSAYGAISTTYTAFAKIKGADHYHYITDSSSQYLAAVDTITGAFLKRMLTGDGTDATKLSSVAAKYPDKIDFQEKGTDTPGGSPSGSTKSSGDSCTCGPENSVGIPTTLPDTVPEPHRSLFTQAASKFNINPAYLTALFLSEQGNVWKPFDSPWASSGVGASGPFQFMPATWQGHATDGDGDGKADIMNIRDAAYSAAHLIAAGTTKDTPMGDITKPFKDPNTILYNAAAYNWGGGNVQSHTNPDSPLSAAPKETQDYLNNVFTLITSGFTKSGKKEYGDPRAPGQSSNNSDDSTTTTSTSESCAGGASGSGTFTAITGSHDELVSKVLSETNIQWGNGLAGASADDEKQDIKDCMTDTAIAGLIALAEQSGVKIIINTMARGHGGCTHAPGSDHNSGRAIDIGYYGNRAQGQGQHNADGDKLYKFIYDNREGLKISQAIWQYPQDGLQCIGGGQPVDCDTYYRDSPGKPVISIHYHHIHIGFKQ